MKKKDRMSHDDPNNAPSDGPCMLNIRDIELLLKELKFIDKFIKSL